MTARKKTKACPRSDSDDDDDEYLDEQIEINRLATEGS